MILYLLFLFMALVLMTNSFMLIRRTAPSLTKTAASAWGAHAVACLVAFQFGDIQSKDYITTWNEYGKEIAYDINTMESISAIYSLYFRDAYILLSGAAHQTSANALALIVLINLLSVASLILLGGLCASLIGNTESAKLTCWVVALWPSTIVYTAHVSPDIVCCSLALMACSHALVATREGTRAHFVSIVCLIFLALFRAHMALLIASTIAGLTALRWKQTSLIVKALYIAGSAGAFSLILIENPLSAGTLDELWTRLNDGVGIKIGLKEDQGGLLGRLAAMPLYVRGLSGILLYPFMPMPFWEYHENTVSGWLRTFDTLFTGLLGAWFFRGAISSLRYRQVDAIWMVMSFAATAGAIGALYSLVDPRFRLTSIVWYLIIAFARPPSGQNRAALWPIAAYFALFTATYALFFRIR